MSFFSEHSDIAYAVISSLLFLLGAAASVIVRLKMGYIDHHDDTQDVILRDHEKRLKLLEGNGHETAKDIEYLSRDLKVWVAELREALRENRAGLDEVKGMIRLRLAPGEGLGE